MRTLYIECNMGAAGDMLMAALSELIPDADAFVARMNALDLPGVRLERRAEEKCGIIGTHIAVTVDGEEELEHLHGHHHEHEHEHEHEYDHDHDHEHEHHHEHDHDHEHHHEHDHDHEHHHDHDHAHGHHHHASLADVRGIIEGLDIPPRVKEDAIRVYERLAAAESEVHGRPMEQLHFHEVGTVDAICDVVGVCLLMAELNPDCVIVSPVHVGSGQVHCAHGVLPVPAPATALLLKHAPIYGGKVRGELCTPTGAALLTHFADGFGAMPVMRVQKIGIGMGTKDFEWANCLRVMLGETDDRPEEVAELRCNLDDMTGEALSFAMDALREAGALDVWSEPIQMKKGRPGEMLCCLCLEGQQERFAALMLKHTTTLGVRCASMRRWALSREALTLDSPWGPVRAKRSFGNGVERVKPEYDDLAEIARREGLTLGEVIERVESEEWR